MHDHDLDLIASLADDSLDDQTEARALIETCQECRQEYEAQVAVTAALATIEPVTMTELEKAALHRDLWTELRSEPAKRATATPWWYRLSYAAAGLFVVVGLVAVVTQLGGSGDTSGDTVAERFSEVGSGLDDGAEAPLYGLEQHPEETGTTAAAEAVSAETLADFAALATETRNQELSAYDRATATEDQVDCLSAAGLENHEMAATVDRDRTYLIAVPAGDDLDADTPITFVDADTCEVVHIEE